MTGDEKQMADALQVDSFVAKRHRISHENRDLLHELTVGVFWPHRARDLDNFIEAGEGYLAVDEIGRPLGSAMSVQAEDNFAMLGMMVTAPRLQSLGTGRWLIRRVMRDCEGMNLRLSATRAGYRLYESAGFIALGTIWQHQGVSRLVHLPDQVAGLDLREMTPGDEAAVRALDHHAFGAKRTGTLDAILPHSSGFVVSRDGVICGFALCRPFGRGRVIGPVVAEDDAMAKMLIAPLIQRHAGEFLRLDTPIDSDDFRAFLAAAGMGNYDTVTEMYYGEQTRPLSGTRLFGLASHSFG